MTAPTYTLDHVTAALGLSDQDAARVRDYVAQPPVSPELLLARDCAARVHAPAKYPGSAQWLRAGELDDDINWGVPQILLALQRRAELDTPASLLNREYSEIVYGDQPVPDLVCVVESYWEMHKTARELGYLSLTEALEALSERTPAQPQASDDGWIPHYGGECPVPLDSKPGVRFRDGSVHTPGGGSATAWAHSRWMHEGPPSTHIIAYKPEPGK